ncbi:PilZ domain-containing protein [Blastococcus sp. TML/M2B]|uniref:flagellar brake protein n=1 Tax=unclassified Blastococcus TaxID=2619396 RepID=UPI00190E22BE|nr:MULTISPECIES: PilZ domain-containing protein [unclassified Blastococcus]MBN1094420.1 PilZ domain-containing protein [Blastococcus sp. TML/M2B]MBN1095379.1 PilZ domain-containing protein [Blastococcus sp. TML/C7B]
MARVPGVDHSEEQSEADVTLAAHGISISSRVEHVSDGVVTVRPSAGEYVEQSVVRPGDSVEVFWRTGATRRALPAEVIEVETGTVVRWRLRVTGPAEESQRRTAVRGRVGLEVTAGIGGLDLTGETLDLSENGMRARFEGFGMLPEAGATLTLAFELEDGAISTKAEVVRAQARGARWMMSLRFVGIQEKDQDRVRRRVFQVLREERARSVE